MLAKLAVFPASTDRTNSPSEWAARDYLIAAALEQVQVVRFFIEVKSLHPDTTDRGKPTALCYAALKANNCLAAYLLSRGADCDHQDAMGMSPLHYAALAGSEYCIALLLSSGASINITNGKGETPLALTINKPHLVRCAELLRQHGATMSNCSRLSVSNTLH